jgi:hypothetical protein
MLFAAGLVLVLWFSTRTQEQAALSREEVLLRRIHRAFKTKDASALLDLHCWDGVTEKHRTLVAVSVEDSVKYTVKDVRVSSEVPGSWLRDRYRNGIRYYNSLPLDGVVRIEVFKQGDQGETEIQEWPYGSKNGILYLTATAEEDLNWDGPDDKHLAVIIWMENPRDLKLRGHYSYNVSGVQRKVEFEYPDMNSWNFYGQYVEECSVQRVSGEGRIQLRIAEDGKEIFQSEWVDSDSPIVYKRSILTTR